MAKKTEPTSQTPEETAAFRKGVSERLRMVRQLVGEQVDVARAIGVSQTVWGRYERNQREIDLQTLVVFCLYFGVCPRWILMGDLTQLNPELCDRLLKEYPEARVYQESSIRIAQILGGRRAPPTAGDPPLRTAARARRQPAPGCSPV